MTDKSDQTAATRGARPRFSLRQLEAFVAIVKSGSTRAGAERIARSQSAASSSIAELESVLGAALFDRAGRRLVLNESGAALLPKATVLLEQAAEVQQLFRGDAGTAPLRVAASLTIGEFLLPGLIARWKAAHPASTVQLAIGNTSETIDAVVGYAADVGFIEGMQTHADLVVVPWLDDELAIVASPRHALAGKRAGLRQLREAAWALREAGSGTREAADRWLLEHLGPIRVEFEFGSTEAIKQLVGAGAALGCLSRRAIERDVAHGLLVELKTVLPIARRRLALVLRRGRATGRGTGEFIRYCREQGGGAQAPMTLQGAAAGPDGRRRRRP